jgi:hypothetical protein
MSSSPPPLIPIECPRCKQCNARMTLITASAAPNHHETRVFECARCNLTSAMVVDDPMRSDALRWLSGELGRSE